MSTLRHDLWFFRKLMATREVASIALYAAFMIFILVRAEADGTYPLILLSFGFCSGLLSQRIKEQQQLVLLPGFIKTLPLIISASFLLLAMVVYIPISVESTTHETAKLAIFFCSLGLFFGFYIHITAWLFALLPLTLFASAFGFDEPANYLIVKPVTFIYNDTFAFVIVVLLALSHWTYGAFIRQSYIGARRKMFWQTMNSEQKNWSINSSSNKIVPRANSIKVAFITLIGFILLEELAIITALNEADLSDRAWAIAGLFAFFSIRITTTISNIDRLWLSSRLESKALFLLQLSLKNLIINLGALLITYLYAIYRSPDTMVILPWFIVFYLLLSALSFISLKKRFTISLCTLLSFGLFYLFIKTPVWAVIIAGALYTMGLYNYAKGYGFNNGRLSAPTFGVAKV